MVSRAGFSADLSGPVMTRARLPLRQRLLAARRRHPRLLAARPTRRSNTAFRGFGGPQGAIAIEIHHRQRSRASSARDPLDVRRANFYGTDRAQRHAVRPDGRGQRDPRARRRARSRPATTARAARAIAAFNATSPVLKRGLALTPVKFGISFNVVALQPGRRAGARLHRRLGAGEPRRHRDGPGAQHQGRAGRRARARRRLRRTCASPRPTRSKVANTSATAASTGSDLNGKAAQDAARQITRAAGRLRRRDATAARAERRALRRRRGARRRQDDAVSPSSSQQAYAARVQLWSDGFYATPGLHWDRDTMQGRPFFYFAYGAAVSRGRRRHADRRVEAAARRRAARRRPLAQSGDRHRPGRGRLHPGHGLAHDGRAVVAPRRTGLLMTHAPRTYKIPTANDCPPIFRVAAASRTATSRTRSIASRRSASRRCCCRSRCSSRSATRSRASAAIASIRRSTRRRRARRS